MAAEAVGGEWVGGCFSAPAYVMEETPERPDVILWMDAASGLMVGMRLDRAPLGPDDVAACLEQAIAEPLPPARVAIPPPPPAPGDGCRRAIERGEFARWTARPLMT